MGRSLATGTHVVKQCEHGLPLVIDVPPSILGRTPTLFWLTCPYLKSKVGVLENQGFARLLSLKLREDGQIRHVFTRRLRKLRVERRELAGDSARDIPTTILESGVDGTRDPLFVKCLHAHLADYLAGNDNPVGALVAQSVDLASCEGLCCPR